MEKKGQLLFKIRDRIYSGYYWPREKLAETALAEEMNVSRTIIREVLKELATKGLVVILPHKGASVAEISYEKLKEFVQLEAVLEGSAAYLAAQLLSSDQIKELHAVLKRSENTEDPQVWSLMNRSFHTIINSGCGNSKLIDVIRDNVSFLKFWFIQLSTSDEIAARNRVHQEILKALEKKKPSLARELVEKHVGDSLGDLLKRIQVSNPAICKSRTE
ncbi:MAG: GntR family transcriptional regulator [Desulfobacteraceae bacterium]|nr:MAG: GntR family transcriptional regulator [Desulfobacteraceae bacterium]